MQELTVRERYERLFRGEPIDRIPVCPRVFENVVFEYFDSKDIDYLESIAEYCKHFGFDTIDWNCTELPVRHFELTEFKQEGPNWKPKITHEKTGDTQHEVCTVETPKGTLRRVISETVTGKFEVERAITEPPIKTEEDFHMIEEYMPEAEIDNSMIKRMKEILGQDGLVSPSAHGPFNIIAYCYRKVDELFMDTTLRPELYHRMMKYFTQRLLKVMDKWAEAEPDFVDIGANIAGANAVSPKFLVEHILPYENQLADYLQDRGILALYHNCGMARGHLDVYDQLHHRIWGYVSPPPHGDCDLKEVIEKVPKDLILWGHVDQIDFLREATPKEIEERVKYICETVKPRGNFILGTSDYIEVNTPPENIRAFVEAGKKYGRYDT